ncbi:MAG: leucine-rich repeat domain-containing protein, partial [Ruminococcus sp.]|nr:leucine-rich repeat domain-containing protein [Ruminococcus sp.]
MKEKIRKKAMCLCFMALIFGAAGVCSTDSVRVYADDAYLDDKYDKYPPLYQWDKNVEELVVPSGEENVELKDYPYLKKVTLPETMSEIVIKECPLLETIVVDEENSLFSSVDGVLYAKQGKELLHYPRSKKDKEFVIPDGVEIIKKSAAEGSKYLESVFIPSSVIELESSAFADSSVHKVSFSEGLEKIDAFAFSCCQIGMLKLPQSLKMLAAGAFEENTRLREITIPAGVETVVYPFYNCPNLEEITFMNSENTDADYKRALLYCRKLTVYVPDDTKHEYEFERMNVWMREPVQYVKKPLSEKEESFVYIADDEMQELIIPETVDGNKVTEVCIFDNSVITSVTIPAGVKRITVEGCDALEEINVDEDNVYFSSSDGILYDKTGEKLVRYPEGRKEKEFSGPEGVETIGIKAFYGNDFLRDVNFSEGLKIIDEHAFSGCQLENIKLPQSVEELCFSCFGCNNYIQKINIPKNTWYAYKPFRYSYNIQEVTMERSEIYNDFEDYVETDYFYLDYGAIIQKMRVPAVAKDQYLSFGFGQWEIETYDTGEDFEITFTGYKLDRANTIILAYRGNDDYISSNLGLRNSISVIGEKAFYQQTKINKIYWHEGIKKICAEAFYGCTFEATDLPESLEIIEKNAFSANASLKSFVIPENVIKADAPFADCVNL